ncbi:hypothetical protein ASPZODRAFT_128559 [Penicilliopsis zonata CBS 506.65]|uniref:MHD domain-containing protein n=1 Tax=Penicilliopsis zonata CBS 506.65 TaxID=1073090 RepID=A0A1L9SS65_9EURO|nr:hypothetical protein ASPZODRAFT_128559 [Penicilliopsis zonata CBS 506.65]OJJ49973.1 hypothetical protein ASPZODRAFT_128559 [Penicilliopsis zonata CBS 506.65]
MMELSRQEYPALLANLHPNQATAVLSDRVRIINKVNSDIADWLQERRRVEEAYVQGLRRLANRPQLENGAALGIFQLPWQRILNATEMLASSHETLAQKIEEDVERPLREYGTKNRDLGAMNGIQADLASLAKSLDLSQKKLDKAKDRGLRGAEKLASAVVAVEEGNQQWQSRAPFVFEQLQAVDESRVNHLRDVLTQLETHEVDHTERCRQAAESCLNVLLNVETADEIKTFATRINGGRPVVPRSQEASGSSTAAAAAAAAPELPQQQQLPLPSPPARAESPLPPPPPVTAAFHDDAASQRSVTSGPSRTPTAPELRPRETPRTKEPAPPPPQPRHSGLSGLKRLGTVMSRRKSIAQSPGGAFGGAEKKSRGPFPSFKRGDSSGQIPIPESPPRTAGADRPQTALTTAGSIRRPSTTLEEDHPRAMSPIPAIQPASPTTNGTGAHDAQHELPANEPRVDSEGYTERPQIIDEITRAEREAAGVEDAGLNLTIRDQPILEDEDQAKEAMDSMANTLRLRAQQTSVRRNAGTLRGRRDVRNTVFIPNPPSAGAGQEPTGLNSASDVSAPTSPSLQTRHGASPSLATEDHTLSDTTSIRSSHTLHSISGPVTHPELHEPGLNASIIETVSAWFSEGAVTKSFVVGELALAYNTPSSPSSSSSEAGLSPDTRIRLDNFQVLEKVAANPHFVSEVSSQEEKRGEYNLVMANIARPLPTVAFKYQIHIDPTHASAYCPVIFHPAWNLEANQASAIIQYTLNPEFAPVESITLRNVILTVNLDTSTEDEVTKQPREAAHAIGAVMYPNAGATFRRKQSAVVWRIPEIEVKSTSGGSGTTSTPGKFLVRFATAGGKPYQGKVDVKFELHTVDASSRLGISAAASSEAGTAPSSTDPFADEGTPVSPVSPAMIWKPVPTVRKLVGGKYVSS